MKKKNEQEKDTMALIKSNASYKSANTRLTNINKSLREHIEVLKLQVNQNCVTLNKYDELMENVLQFNAKPWYKRMFSKVKA